MAVVSGGCSGMIPVHALRIISIKRDAMLLLRLLTMFLSIRFDLRNFIFYLPVIYTTRQLGLNRTCIIHTTSCGNVSVKIYRRKGSCRVMNHPGWVKTRQILITGLNCYKGRLPGTSTLCQLRLLGPCDRVLIPGQAGVRPPHSILSKSQRKSLPPWLNVAPSGVLHPRQSR